MSPALSVAPDAMQAAHGMQAADRGSVLVRAFLLGDDEQQLPPCVVPALVVPCTIDVSVAAVFGWCEGWEDSLTVGSLCRLSQPLEVQRKATVPLLRRLLHRMLAALPASPSLYCAIIAVESWAAELGGGRGSERAGRAAEVGQLLLRASQAAGVTALAPWVQFAGAVAQATVHTTSRRIGCGLRVSMFLASLVSVPAAQTCCVRSAAAATRRRLWRASCCRQTTSTVRYRLNGGCEHANLLVAHPTVFLAVTLASQPR